MKGVVLISNSVNGFQYLDLHHLYAKFEFVKLRSRVSWYGVTVSYKEYLEVYTVREIVWKSVSTTDLVMDGSIENTKSSELERSKSTHRDETKIVVGNEGVGPVSNVNWTNKPKE